jgi:hypothetical protein
MVKFGPRTKLDTGREEAFGGEMGLESQSLPLVAETMNHRFDPPLLVSLATLLPGGLGNVREGGKVYDAMSSGCCLFLCTGLLLTGGLKGVLDSVFQREKVRGWEAVEGERKHDLFPSASSRCAKAWMIGRPVPLAPAGALMASSLESLVYTPGEKGQAPTLRVLDQLLVPRTKAYIDVRTVGQAWKVRGLQRGKP